MKNDAVKITMQENIHETIHKSMSYDDLLANTIACTEEDLPCLSDGTLILALNIGATFFFFLDVTSIFPSRGLAPDAIKAVPINFLLLNMYGVSEEQFIAAYTNKVLAESQID